MTQQRDTSMKASARLLETASPTSKVNWQRNEFIECVN